MGRGRMQRGVDACSVVWTHAAWFGRMQRWMDACSAEQTFCVSREESSSSLLYPFSRRWERTSLRLSLHWTLSTACPGRLFGHTRPLSSNSRWKPVRSSQRPSLAFRQKKTGRNGFASFGATCRGSVRPQVMSLRVIGRTQHPLLFPRRGTKKESRCTSAVSQLLWSVYL